MKKLFLAMAAIAAFAFVGCSKDDGDVTPSTENLVGTWQLYMEADEIIEDVESYGYIEQLIFKPDNTVELIQKEEYNGQWHTHGDLGSYKISGNKLTLYYPSREDQKDEKPVEEYIIEKLTAEELILAYEIEERGEIGVERYGYKRIK